MDMNWCAISELFRSYENAIIINVGFQFKHIPPCRLKCAYFRHYANEDHQRVATLSCINTILAPAVAVKISRLFPPSLRTLLYTFSLGVSIQGSDGCSGTLYETRQTQLATHTFSPSIYFSFLIPLSLSPTVARLFSFFPFLLCRVFPFNAFPQFLDARHSAPLHLLFSYAA